MASKPELPFTKSVTDCILAGEGQKHLLEYVKVVDNS
jgi:hypothetical protein